MSTIIETLKSAPYNYNIVDTEVEFIKTLSVAGNSLYLNLKEKPDEWNVDVEGKWVNVNDSELPIQSKNDADAFIQDYREVILEGVDESKFKNEDDNGFKAGGFQKIVKEQEQKRIKQAVTKQLVKTGSVAVAVQNFKYSSSQIQAIKETVAKGATDAEFEMLMYLADRYQLDPILKEIFYSAQMKTIMTSRDGYLKIAQRDPTFEGIQSMAVCENDEFELDVPNHTVIHKFGKGDRGNVIGGWAIVYRKGRHPVIAYAPLKEHASNNPAWKYKSAMSCKCAESFALKRQFSISGLVTQEELGFENVIDAEYEIQGEGEASF
jgi:hypothetical protein